MRKRSIADGRSRDGRKPTVEHRKLCRQGRQDWKLIGSEVRHDIVRAINVVRLMEIILDETLHVGDASRSRRRSTEDLKVDPREVVVWIRIQLALKFCVWLNRNGLALSVRIGLISC